MASPYVAPDWSGVPSHRISVEMMRGGVVVDEMGISDRCTYSVGRNKDSSDIYIDDQYVSRLHAYIQHKIDDTSYIYDMDSTHGTYLNKKRIDARQYVRIRDGDLLRFGPVEDSFFIVKIEGEDHIEEDIHIDDRNEEKAALDRYIEKEKNRTFKEIYEDLLSKELPEKGKKNVKKIEYDRTEVTWGMVDEEIIYADKTDQEVIRTDILRRMPNLTPRHISKIEDFEKKQRRMKLMIV